MLLLRAALLLVTAAWVDSTSPMPLLCPDGIIYGGVFCPPTRSVYDTIFTTTGGRTLGFKDNVYWELSDTGLRSGQSISNIFPGLPSSIDAAFTVYWPGQSAMQTYFMKKDKFWRYTGSSMDSGYPKNINTVFPGVPNKLDAVVASSHGGFVYPRMYFFKGPSFWIYTHYPVPHVSEAKSISRDLNRGIPDNMDAAFRFTDGYVYFVKDHQYFRWDEVNYTITAVSAPFTSAVVDPYPYPVPYPVPVHTAGQTDSYPIPLNQNPNSITH